MSKPENPPAFPVRIEHPLGCVDIHHGMTLRDWFAGQALAGFLSNGSQRLINEALKESEHFALIQDTQAKESVVNGLLVEGCYKLADAMLTERVS